MAWKGEKLIIIIQLRDSRRDPVPLPPLSPNKDVFPVIENTFSETYPFVQITKNTKTVGGRPISPSSVIVGCVGSFSGECPQRSI